MYDANYFFVANPLNRFAIGGLLALGFGVRVLERNEFGLRGLGHHRLFFRHRRGRARSGRIRS